MSRAFTFNIYSQRLRVEPGQATRLRFKRFLLIGRAPTGAPCRPVHWLGRYEGRRVETRCRAWSATSRYPHSLRCRAGLRGPNPRRDDSALRIDRLRIFSDRRFGSGRALNMTCLAPRGPPGAGPSSNSTPTGFAF